MELVGLFFAVLAALLVLYGLSKLGQIHQEIRRQSQILYEIAVALKADVPESLRPRAGFFAEFSRGLKGK
jgi:hypothetical protein